MFGCCLVCIMLVVPCVGAQTQDFDDPVGVADIVAKQEEWLNRFAVLRVRWREWTRVDVMEYNPDVPRDATLENSPVYSIEEFCWSDFSGISHESVSYTNGKIISRDIYGTDGQQPWDAKAVAGEKGDFTHWDHLILNRNDSERPFKTNINMVAVYGLWNSSGEWFPARIRSAESPVILDSDEEVDGNVCVVIQFSSSLMGTKKEETFWFDAKIGYMPRKFRMEASTENASWVETWTADKFTEVEPGAFFPAHGFFHIDKIPLPGFEWLIETVEFNPALPADQFKPRISVGSRITDYHGGRAYLAGPAGLKGPQEAPVATQSVTAGEAVTAVPPSSEWRKYTVLCFLVVFTLVCLKLLRNVRRSTNG